MRQAMYEAIKGLPEEMASPLDLGRQHGRGKRRQLLAVLDLPAF